MRGADVAAAWNLSPAEFEAVTRSVGTHVEPGTSYGDVRLVGETAGVRLEAIFDGKDPALMKLVISSAPA